MSSTSRIKSVENDQVDALPEWSSRDAVCSEHFDGILFYVHERFIGLPCLKKQSSLPILLVVHIKCILSLAITTNAALVSAVPTIIHLLDNMAKRCVEGGSVRNRPQERLKTQHNRFSCTSRMSRMEHMVAIHQRHPGNRYNCVCLSSSSDYNS